jgi:hypothetical protein
VGPEVIALRYTKIGVSEQAFRESEMRRAGDGWEVVTRPDGLENITGDLGFQEARRCLGAWRRARAQQLLAGNPAAPP